MPTAARVSAATLLFLFSELKVAPLFCSGAPHHKIRTRKLQEDFVEPVPAGRRKWMAMHGKRGQGARRPHGQPWNDEQRSPRLPGAAATTHTCRDRFLA